jgi:hypothetical protein
MASAPACVRRCGQISTENFALTQRYDRYTIAAVISMRVRFEPERSSAMRAKISRLAGLPKMKTRRAIDLAQPLSRGAARAKKARHASRTRRARRSTGRIAARVEVRRVCIRWPRPVSTAGLRARVSPAGGKECALRAGTRSSDTQIFGGRGAVRVAVEVGRGKLVIVIVQKNLKQESCI